MLLRCGPLRPHRGRRPEGLRRPRLGRAEQSGLRAQHRRADRHVARARLPGRLRLSHGLEEESPYDTLGREHPGNAFKEVLEGEPDLLVTKHVNSAFHGSPDLEAWLRANGVDAITVCGIQTQMCCETTARVGANLGFEMTFAIDATHTFDLPAYGGGTLRADEVARVTGSNLDPEFGRVATTAELTG